MKAPPPLPIDQALRTSASPPVASGLSRQRVVAVTALLALLLASRLVCSSAGPRPEAATGRDARRAYRLTDEMIERGLVGTLPKDYTFLTERHPEPRPQPVAEVESPPEPPPPDATIDLEEQEWLRTEAFAALDAPILYDSANPPRPPGISPARPSIASKASLLAAPGSPFTIQAGTILPAALVTPINSELPGPVVGRVTQAVYDSVSGAHVLIPQGTRLVGRYDNNVRYGQRRVLVAWTRMILPGGASLELGDMPAADAAGASGLPGRVDYHTPRLAAATLLSTLIALGGNLAATSTGERGPFDVAGQTAAQQAASLGGRIIDRELNVPPTIRIAAGTVFHVLVTRDFTLPPSGD